MKTKIQFETRNSLPEQAGITKIKDLSYLVSHPDSFRYECSPEWAQGKDITVEQVAIFWEGIFIAGKSDGDTLGHFVEKWKEFKGLDTYLCSVMSKGATLNDDIYRTYRSLSAQVLEKPKDYMTL